MSRDWKVIEHQFGSGATLQKQIFSTGSGLRRFTYIRSSLSIAERRVLLAFYTSVLGSLSSFTYNAPNIDSSGTTAYTVIFELAPLSFTDLADRVEAGINFLEIIDPNSPPSLPLNNTLTRFPNSTLSTALLSEVQVIIPLFRIQVRDSSVPPLYLSDRRVVIGGQLYLPRVTSIGEPGSDVIMSQDISGRADNIQFTLGNADRAMSLFVQDTGLKFADVQFSLYHAGTGIKLDLWRGFVQNWQIDGSAKFKLFCSDGLYPVTLAYPQRKVSHQCWKKFNDGINCPFSSSGASGGALIALGGDPHSCDFFFNTPNGCLAHGMSPFFGGHPAAPQSVSIKDNGTGVLNLFRDTVTSTSIVADSIWGRVLPEIWCNNNGDPLQDFIADTIIVAVRDESDFEDVLGIVGVGPIGQFGIDDPRPGGPISGFLYSVPIPPGEGGKYAVTADGYPILVTPLADGYPPYGLKVDLAHPGDVGRSDKNSDLGLRQIHGEDPVLHTQPYTVTAAYANGAFSLGQGTPQHWDEHDPTFSNIDTGAPNNILPLAAGTAFVELRYAKSAGSGILPTNTQSHSMTVPIAKGLTGINSAFGTLAPGLTNPFWVAVSCYLRALGLIKAPSSTQTQYYIPTSLFVGDGSGCAEIADLPVTPIFGGGTETQFVFNGSLSESKPFRDWLPEILSCCLGYFSFEFGRLRLGIRENASASTAFTLGNMIFQSFSCTPIQADFESLRILFANRALQYQNDQAEYTDKDHAEYFGRTDAALQTDMRSVGMCNMSQALRVAATRTREEIGGILRPDLANKYAEWDGARDASLKTTILSLETYIGQVVSITHPDVPTYPGPVGGSPFSAHTWNFRIRNWTLYKDWSISLGLRSVTDSMYDLDVGPKPTNVTPSKLPILYQQPSSLPAWAPDNGLAQTPANDPLFPNELSFDLAQTYAVLDDSSVDAKVTLSGRLPVTMSFNNSGAPDISNVRVTQSTTGGSIKGGLTLRVQFASGNGIGGFSAASKILIVQIPTGTNTNTFTVAGIIWPTDVALTQAWTFASDFDQLVCAQQTDATSASSITVTGPFKRSTFAVPNTRTKKIRVRTRDLIHGGVAGAPIDSLDTTSITCSELIDVALTDNYAGYPIAVIGRNPGSAPYFHARCTAFDPATGKITLDRDPTAFSQPVLAGDVIVVCFLGYDNSSNQYNFADLSLSNATNPTPHTGETAHDPNRIGNAVFVLAGKSRGQSAKITDNGATDYTLDQPLALDATSVVIVVGPSWSAPIDGASFTNADNSVFTSISIPITNKSGASYLVAAFTVDVDDVESFEEFAPARMLYSFGLVTTVGLPSIGAEKG